MHGALTVGMVENWHFHLLVSYFITENMGLMEFIWDDPTHAVQDAGQYAYTKRMYAFANYSKFVRPGYRRIDIGATAAGVLASAYRYAATGAVSIVAINTNASAAALPIFFTRNAPLSLTPWVTSAAYNLEAQAPVTITGNGVFNVTLPATSVTTLVGIEGQ
jgi:O-glycosyl hydrolase